MNLDHDFRSRLLQLATIRPIRQLMAPATRDKVPIFVLHRMEDKERGVSGFSAQKLRAYLRFLERRGTRFVSLDDVFNKMSGDSSASFDNAVAFTMDDGFADQVDIALPVFQEFSCPVTMFLITGFVDGKLWPWDDQVAYVFDQCQQAALTVRVGGESVVYNLSSTVGKQFARRDFRASCKRVTHKDQVSAVKLLAEAAHVRIPKDPPPAYIPTTWAKVRAAESDLIRFGPHTESHGIVSRMPSRMAAREISESWARLSSEVDNPLNIFAWPNGQTIDFGPREMANLDVQRIRGAVTTEHEVADTSVRYSHRFSRYQVGRLSIPDSAFDLVQYTSWIAQLKWLVRGDGLRAKFSGRRHFVKYCSFKLAYLMGGFRRQSDIEWSRVDRLVFVCKGNICRSPYAELKAGEMGMNSVSAGLEASGTSGANSSALRIAEYRNIDLSHHISTRFSTMEIRRGDLVVCMTPRHHRLVANAVRASGGQLTLLGLFNDPPAPYIPDPYGGLDEYFQRCFQIIDEALFEICRIRGFDHRQEGDE